MSAQLLVRASDVQPGNAIEFSGTEPYLHADNIVSAENTYAVVESVNGGWADSLAGPGEVVLYVPNYPLPIILPAATEVTVDPTVDTSC